MMTAAELSRRCDEHARREAERSRTVVAVGPFSALLDPSTDLIWLNYAVPVGPLDDEAGVAAALEELGRVFVAHGRALRFEFNALPWPELPPLLERAGLQLQVEHPVMVCTPAMLVARGAPGVAVRLLDVGTSDAELRAIQTILQLSFGGDVRELSDTELLALRAGLADGTSLRGVATINEAPAGTGSLTLIDATAELVGVATHPQARRRGVAAALSSALVGAHFARGGRLAWLSAGDAIAQAVYSKVGFERVDVRLNYLGAAP